MEERALLDRADSLLQGFKELTTDLEGKLRLLGARGEEILVMEERMRACKARASEKLPDLITFNVGGVKFTTTKCTLTKGDTFFTAFLDSGVPPDDKGVYFLDRSPKLFGVVLEYLRSGTLDLRGRAFSDIQAIRHEFQFYLLPWDARYWENFGSSLTLSDDGRTVSNILEVNSADLSRYFAFGCSGWMTGVHCFKIKLGGNHTRFGVEVGVSEGNSGNITDIRPYLVTNLVEGEIVSLTLNCDAGTLVAAIGRNPLPYCTITVPKNKTLYPFAKLPYLRNSAEFIY